MPKHNKDYTNCVNMFRLEFRMNQESKSVLHAEARTPRNQHFFMVYLWSTQDDMFANVPAPPPSPDSVACFAQQNILYSKHPLLNLYLDTKIFYFLQDTVKLGRRALMALGWKIHTGRRVGELHFVRGLWDWGVVAHECLHAILHALRIVDGYRDVEDNTMRFDVYRGAAEEAMATLLQSMVMDICNDLAEADPGCRPPSGTFGL